MLYGLRDPKFFPLNGSYTNYSNKTISDGDNINAVAIVAVGGSNVHVNINGHGQPNLNLDERAEWQAKSRKIQRLMTMLIYNSHFLPNAKFWKQEAYSEWAAYFDHWLMLVMKPAAALHNFNLLSSSPCLDCNHQFDEKKPQKVQSVDDCLKHLGCDPLLLMPDFEDEDLPLAKKFITLLESDLTRQYNPQSPNYPLYTAWLARKMKAMEILSAIVLEPIASAEIIDSVV